MMMMMAIEKKKIILNSDGKALRPHVSLNAIKKAFYFQFTIKIKILRL